MTRAEFAKELEENRSKLIKLMERCPLEIETHVGDLPYRRMVIDSPADLDRAIAQLRAPAGAIDPRDAVNKSLLVE